MAERQNLANDLAGALQQLRLQQANGSSPLEVTQAQLELLLARIAVLTGELRDAPASEPSSATARLLLADLAMVAAQFRGHTNDLSAQLARVLEDVRVALERTLEPPPASRAG